MPGLIFKDAEVARDSVMASQKKEIASLYEKWADEIGEKAEYYAHKTTSSSSITERQMKELKQMLINTSHQVSNEVYNKIKSNMYLVADEVVKSNTAWLTQFGFSEKGVNAAFNLVPANVVERLITGQVYQSGWSLSKSIWGDNEDTLSKIYSIMAGGLAMNESVYDIAKKLEQFVRPSAKKNWNLTAKDGRKIFPKQVDYNAQRLARTLAQHSYQQSVLSTTEKNPFISEYIWHSNGSRVCELCKSRDGQHYKKDELPMDHPNGMCIMEPVVDEDMNKKLVEWFNSPDGTYPEIDTFAKNFGYEAKPVKSVLDFVNKYGMSTKSPSAWYNSLNQIQKSEAKALKDASGLNWNDWYEKYIYGTGDETQDFIKKYGTSTKSPSSWFNSLTPTQKAEAKALKEKSGLTWNDWYMKNIHVNSDKTAQTTKTTRTSNKTSKSTKSKSKSKVKVFSDLQDKYLSPYGFGPDNMPKNFDDWSHKVSYDQAEEILKAMGTSWSDPHPYQKLMQYYNSNLTGSNMVEKVANATKTAKKANTAKTVVKNAANVADTSGNIPSYKSWINAIRKQTESQMLKMEETWMKMIGEAGKKGIIEYSGSSYQTMNAYLRYLQAGLNESDAISRSGISSSKLKSVKDAIKGLNNVKLEKDYVFRRGTDLGDLAGAFMQGDFRANKRNLYNKSIKELTDMFAGAVGNYGAFTSTSSIYDRGFSGDVEVILYAPKGTSASSIMSISNYGTYEGETLLNANTTVRCVKIEKSDGHKSSKIRVFMEIISKIENKGCTNTLLYDIISINKKGG